MASSYAKQQVTTFQLVGGLGNQLFGYFAGKYYSLQTDSNVRFDTSQFGKGFSEHSSKITSFALPDNFSDYESNRRAAYWLRLAANRLLKYAKIAPERTQRLMRIYDSSTDGYDSGLAAVPSGYLVRGYFQTYKYSSEVLAALGSVISLQNPSSWFLKNASLADRTKPIMVHVRRGDYSRLQQEFGLLAVDYFLQGCQIVRERLADPDREVWIFSDELDAVRNEFSKAGIGLNVRWIEVPKGLDDAESLLLMSRGSGNVISNSTFSWWSAILNPESIVVAPEKWFRGKPDPQDLVPPHWVMLPSIWK